MASLSAYLGTASLTAAFVCAAVLGLSPSWGWLTGGLPGSALTEEGAASGGPCALVAASFAALVARRGLLLYWLALATGLALPTDWQPLVHDAVRLPTTLTYLLTSYHSYLLTYGVTCLLT